MNVWTSEDNVARIAYEIVPKARQSALVENAPRLGRGPGQEGEGHAVTPVVGDDRASRRAQHLVQVVVEQFGVTGERVVLVGRLVREAEAREVHQADTVLGAQRVDHVVPVDAAGGEAVHQQHDGGFRVAALGVEDAEPVG